MPYIEAELSRRQIREILAHASPKGEELIIETLAGTDDDEEALDRILKMFSEILPEALEKYLDKVEKEKP